MYKKIVIVFGLVATFVACQKTLNNDRVSDTANLSQLTLIGLLQEAERMPHSDSLDYYIRQALKECHYSYLYERHFQEGLDCLDSLERNPYIKKHYPHELLSGKAGLNQMMGNNDEALRYADAYRALPPCLDRDDFIRQAEIISGVYMYCGDDIHRAIRVLEEAVEVWRTGGKCDNIIRMLSRLGSYYRLTGEYERAVATNQEAITTYNDSLPAQNVVIAYGEQANLYGELGMYDYALQMNLKGIAYAKRSGGYGLGDLYRYRADLFRQTASDSISFSDSVFHYLRLAEQTSAAQKSFKGVFVNNVQLATCYLEYPDSVQKALSLLLRIGKDTIRMPQWVKHQYELQLGKALQQTGKEQQGMEYIRRAADGFAGMNMVEMELEGNKLLMEYYKKRDEMGKFHHYYERNRLFADSLNNIETRRAVSAANIRFDTERKEKENRLLSTQVKLYEERSFLNIVISVVLLVLLAITLVCLLVRRKANRLAMEEHQQTTEADRREIEQLIARQEVLNSRNEELTEQIKKASATDNLNTVRQLTIQNLLSRENEMEFRKSFATLYPSYLPELRQFYPKLTRTEELLAMLVCMNQTTDEIALVMGINRSSVNVMRSRMRKNMGLTKEQSLDEVLRSLLK